MQKRLEAREKAKEIRLQETSAQRKAQSDAAKLNNLIKKGDKKAALQNPQNVLLANRNKYVTPQLESDDGYGDGSTSYITDVQQLPQTERKKKIKKTKGLKKVSAHGIFILLFGCLFFIFPFIF